MSNYYLTAKNKKTGEVAEFMAVDDHFGKHEYGYWLIYEGSNTILNEYDFSQIWDRILPKPGPYGTTTGIDRQQKIVKITEEDNLGKDEWWCDWYKCPNCKNKNITDSFNYCPMCGSQINWVTK